MYGVADKGPGLLSYMASTQPTLGEAGVREGWQRPRLADASRKTLLLPSLDPGCERQLPGGCWGHALPCAGRQRQRISGCMVAWPAGLL